MSSGGSLCLIWKKKFPGGGRSPSFFPEKLTLFPFKPSKNDTSSGKNQLRRARKKDEFDYDSSRSYFPDRPYDDRNEYKDGNYERNYDNRAGRNYDDRGRDFDNRYDK